MMDVDFGRTAEDYGRFRRAFPAKLFVRLEQVGASVSGRRLVDLGTGTGGFARACALRGAKVTGLDTSMELMDVARKLDAESGAHVRYRVGSAERTGLADGHFEVVTAAQCWWWFDTGKTLGEIRRLLAPGGKLVIASFDWLPLAGNVVEATEALIESFQPDWHLGGGDGLHTEWIDQVKSHGFESVESVSFDVDEPFTHAQWRGRLRASAGVGASLDPQRIESFDRALAELLEGHFPGEPLQVAHRVYAVVASRPSD